MKFDDFPMIVPVSSQGEWAAKRFYGDPQIAAQYLPVAYALLGEVKNRMTLGGITYGHRTVQLPDGTRIRVLRNFEQNIIEIDTSRGGAAKEEEWVTFLCFEIAISKRPDYLRLITYPQYKNETVQLINRAENKYAIISNTPIFNAPGKQLLAYRELPGKLITALDEGCQRTYAYVYYYARTITRGDSTFYIHDVGDPTYICGVGIQKNQAGSPEWLIVISTREQYDDAGESYESYPSNDPTWIGPLRKRTIDPASLCIEVVPVARMDEVVTLELEFADERIVSNRTPWLFDEAGQTATCLDAVSGYEWIIPFSVGGEVITGETLDPPTMDEPVVVDIETLTVVSPVTVTPVEPPVPIQAAMNISAIVTMGNSFYNFFTTSGGTFERTETASYNPWGTEKVMWLQCDPARSDDAPLGYTWNLSDELTWEVTSVTNTIPLYVKGAKTLGEWLGAEAYGLIYTNGTQRCINPLHYIESTLTVQGSKSITITSSTDNGNAGGSYQWAYCDENDKFAYETRENVARDKGVTTDATVVTTLTYTLTQTAAGVTLATVSGTMTKTETGHYEYSVPYLADYSSIVGEFTASTTLHGDADYELATLLWVNAGGSSTRVALGSGFYTRDNSGNITVPIRANGPPYNVFLLQNSAVLTTTNGMCGIGTDSRLWNTVNFEFGTVTYTKDPAMYPYSYGYSCVRNTSGALTSALLTAQQPNYLFNNQFMYVFGNVVSTLTESCKTQQVPPVADSVLFSSFAEESYPSLPNAPFDFEYMSTDLSVGSGDNSQSYKEFYVGGGWVNGQWASAFLRQYLDRTMVTTSSENYREYLATGNNRTLYVGTVDNPGSLELITRTHSLIVDNITIYESVFENSARVRPRVTDDYVYFTEFRDAVNNCTLSFVSVDSDRVERISDESYSRVDVLFAVIYMDVAQSIYLFLETRWDLDENWDMVPTATKLVISLKGEVIEYTLPLRYEGILLDGFIVGPSYPIYSYANFNKPDQEFTPGWIALTPPRGLVHDVVVLDYTGWNGLTGGNLIYLLVTLTAFPVESPIEGDPNVNYLNDPPIHSITLLTNGLTIEVFNEIFPPPYTAGDEVLTPDLYVPLAASMFSQRV